MQHRFASAPDRLGGICCRFATPTIWRQNRVIKSSSNNSAAIVSGISQQFDALSGLVCPGTEVEAGVTAFGRGLVATRDLRLGDCILSVDAFNLLCITDEPLKTGNVFGAAALADFQLLHGELPPLLASYLTSSRADWFKRLVAWLLWLSQHGTGIWQLYTQLLPEEAEMSSLMNFTPEERPQLQFPHLISLADKERRAIQGLHDTVFSGTGDLRSLDLSPTFQHTLWACCMVNSRCFSDNVGREALSLLVPCCDLANHSMQPNAGYRLDPETQTFQITLTEDVSAGSEVLISYLGSKPSKTNTDLMKDYGFVLPGNKNDTISFVPTGAPHPLLDAAELMAAASESLPGPRHEDQQQLDTARQRQQAVMKSLKPFVQLGSASTAGKTHSQAAKRQMLDHLERQCERMLGMCSTSLQEDKDLLAGAGGVLTPRMQAAVAARLEHKRLIAAAQDLLQAYASNLQ